MIKYCICFFSIIIAIHGCKNRVEFDSESLKKVNSDYSRFKSKFDESLINHFPKKVTHIVNFVICKTNIKKNDIGLYLVESKLSDEEIKNLEKQIDDSHFVAKYTSKDTCLLKINSFETFESLENYKVVEIIDTTLVNKPCYKDKHPIPNFWDYSIERKVNFWKDENFTIYVYNAKSGNFSKNFELQSNPQMPIEWKNGYSKGVALSKEKRTIIYWCAIW